jgi:hypothetical protein
MKSAAAEVGSTFSPAVEVSRVHYQRQISVAGCGASGGCEHSFAPLTAKQRVELSQVSCFVEVATGNTAFIQMSYKLANGEFFQLPVSMTSQFTSSLTGITFQQQTNLFLPPNSALLILAAYTGPGAIVTCQALGDLVTLK